MYIFSLLYKFRYIAIIGALVLASSYTTYRLTYNYMNAKVQTIEAKHSRELADTTIRLNLEKEQAEKELINHAEESTKKKNAEIKRINSQLNTALSELRNRPSREDIPKGDTPNTPTCERATGAELYREDAEFLTREAARADTLREALRESYERYDEVKRILDELRNEKP